LARCFGTARSFNAVVIGVVLEQWLSHRRRERHW
jgi:hypothetical protein